MSKPNLCSRLSGLFSTTPKTPKSTIPPTKLEPKRTKPEPKRTKPTIPTTKPDLKRTKPTIPTTKPEPKRPKGLYKNVNDLLREKDSQALVEKFKNLSECSYFRERCHSIYKVTIHRLALANQFPLIEHALETQEKHCITERFASQIIFLYGKNGMFDHAYKVFDEMPERKCSRRVTSLNALLSAASNSGKYDKVWELFRELPEKLSIKPNVASYNAVIHAMCKLGLVEDALLLLDEMEKNGLEPDVISYKTLLSGYYESGAFEEGDKLWERMINNGKVPATQCYNFKLQGLIMNGKLPEALELAMQLKDKGVNLNVSTYNVVIAGLIKDDDLDCVREWYEKMVKSGCQPNKTTFSTLVPFLCGKGDYELAFQVCSSMLQGRNCLIDEDGLQNVVNGLVNNSMADKAKTLVELGLARSDTPYVVNGLVNNSLADKAEMLVKLWLANSYNPYKLVMPDGV